MCAGLLFTKPDIRCLIGKKTYMAKWGQFLTTSSNPISGCGIIVFDVLINGKGIHPIVIKKLNPGTLVLCKHHLLKAKHSCCALPQCHKTYFL